MTQQFLRACSLRVADAQGNGVELAGPTDPILRIRFTVNYQTSSTPAALHARVYNLSKTTLNNLVSLASKNPPTGIGIPFPSSAQVVLMAGYVQNLGQLFKGQIYQMRWGYENSTDSYLDIFAADGNLSHAYAVSNTTFAAGYTAVDQWNYFGKTFEPWGTSTGAPPAGLDTTKSPRGKVLFGSTRDRADDLAATYNFNWNIYNGQFQGLPNFTFRPGDSVVINHSTGQIGFPEQTEEGVTVTCLLNPAIKWGTHGKLNNPEISKLLLNTVPGGTPVTGFQIAGGGNALAPTYVPPIDADGQYVVCWAEHTGDTRGNDWYTKFACISVDPSSHPSLVTSRIIPTPPR